MTARHGFPCVARNSRRCDLLPLSAICGDFRCSTGTTTGTNWQTKNGAVRQRGNCYEVDVKTDTIAHTSSRAPH